MATKRKIRRSRSLSDILKVCIPNTEKKENKDISKKQEKSAKTTDCCNNEEKTVSLGAVRDLNKDNVTSRTNKEANTVAIFSPEDSKVSLTARQYGGSRGPQKKQPSRKSYRRKRRATLADLTCIDILNPIPEMEEEEPEFNATRQANLNVESQFCKDSTINRHEIELQLGHVDHKGESGQRQSQDEMIEDLKQWKEDMENLEYTKNIPNESDILSPNGHNGESFGQRSEPSNEESDSNRDVEEQDAIHYLPSEDSDEGSESTELKLALSNYEITYDVDENENAIIFERLRQNYKKSMQRSDSLSSLATKSSGSDGSMSSVSPVDEKLLHEKMQTVEVPGRRRRFSTSDLHLRCLLHALPSISEEGKKNSISSSASSDSNESTSIDLMRRRSGSLPNILAFRQATIKNQRNDDNPEEIKEENEDDRSSKQQNNLGHCDATLPGNHQLLPPKNETASKKIKRRNSMSVFEDVRLKNSNDPVATQNGNLVPDVPLSIEKNVSLENGGTEGFSKKSSIKSKNLVKALGQKMRASIRRRNSIASLKPWTGIVEKSLRSSFPIPAGKENDKNETKDKMQEIPTKNNAEDLRFLSRDHENQEKDNVIVLQRETLPDFQSQKDFTKSSVDNFTGSGLKSQKSTNSAFTQVKKRYEADKEKNIKSLTGNGARAKASTKTSLMSESDDQIENSPPHLTANDESQSKVSTFSRSKSSSVKETPDSKPKKFVKPSSTKSNTVRPESPKLENKIKVPIETTLSNPLPRRSPNLNRPASPSAFTSKNKSMMQNSALSPRSVKGPFDNKKRPAKSPSNRPPSPSPAVSKQEGIKQELPSSKSEKRKADAKAPSNRPPSPSPAVSKQEGIKQELLSSKSEKNKVDAKALSNRPPSPSTVTKTNKGKKHDISTSKNGKGTLAKASLNRPPSPLNIVRAHQEISTSTSKISKGTLAKAPANRPSSPSAITRKNQGMNHESSSVRSVKGTTDKETPPKTASNRPPSPSAFTKTNQRTKPGFSSTINEKKINNDDGKLSGKAASKPSQKGTSQTRKRDTNSSQVTRKAGTSYVLNEKKEVPLKGSNKPTDHGVSKKDSATAENEEKHKDKSDRAMESIAADVAKVNSSDVGNVNSEDVPKKQVMNKEEKPTEKVTKDENVHKSEKVNGVTIVEVPKIIPDDTYERTRSERKTSVNVIRRPLSASLCITVPATSSPEVEKENPNQDKKPNALSPDTSSGKSRNDNKTYQELSDKQVKVDHNPDQGIEKELDSFGSLLEEFEKSPPLPIKSNMNPATLEQSSYNNEADKLSNEAIPTEKRFAALSERYNAIMAKFGMSKTSPTERTTAVETTSSALSITSSLSESKVRRKLGIGLPVSEDSNKARSSILTTSENRVGNVGYSSPVPENNSGKAGITPAVPEYNIKSVEVRLQEVSDTASNKDDSTPEPEEKVETDLPVGASLTLSKNKATLPISGDNIKKDERVKSPESSEVNRDSLPLSENRFRENEISLPASKEKLSSGAASTPNHTDNLLHSSSDGTETKTSALKTPYSPEIEMKENLNTFTHFAPPVPINADDLNGHQDVSSLPISKVDQEKDPRSEKKRRENIHEARSVKQESKPTIPERTVSHGEQKVQSLIRGAQQTTGSMTSKDTKDGNELRRTTVIARLIDRKLGPRRKTSIVPTLAVRKSKVFDDSDAGIKEIPYTMEHFNRYRNYIEKVTLKSTVRTEAMSIHDILNSLDSSLMEMELIALCKECTKTLRTLDALGSLPSYLSPNTVIVNPSGTIKFRHLNTDVTIDELFLAPEHSKKFSSEKTCVFSLAVTIWLAADWKLTEHNKPALSRKFQELLVSMTTDSSTERASLDSVLQTCESLHTDNEMTSRERCQALLWECQATKDLDKQNVDKKAIEESKKTKAQHAILMGSVSVAANVKGFLKQTQSPAEPKIVQNTKSRDIQNKSLERKGSIELEIDHTKSKQPNPRAPSPAAGSMFSHYHNPADPSMMFSPISGNPKPNHQSSFPAGQSQTSTPTFVPIAVPVPTAGPPPMWYMTPSGMVPFGPMGHHPGYFVPVNQGSGSSVVSDGEISGINEMTPKEIGRNSRPSTPMSETSQESSVSKTSRNVTPSTKSKIPRPIRDPNRRSPRPSNSRQPKDEPKSFTTSWPSEESQVRRNKNDETYTSTKTESSASSHEHGGTTTSLYRSHTPPVRLRSGSSELEGEDLRRPRPRSSTGSLVSSPPSGERTSRPSSPSFSEGRSGSRPSSPVGSRSSSPVAALISRFEDLSTKQQASEHSQSVSNLLSKFGSSSLLHEDRLTKRQFKTNTPQTKEHNYYGRSGPFRPTSAANQLSRELHSDTNESLSKSWPAKPTQRQPSQNDAPSLNGHNSPPTRNLRNKETSRQTRNRLALSLENLSSYGEEKRQSTEQYSMVRNRERSWASMENVHKASNEEQMIGYRIKKSSSAENLSKEHTDIDFRPKEQGVSSITSQGLRKSLKEKSYSGYPYVNDKGIDKDGMALVRQLSLERTRNDLFENMTTPRETEKRKSRYLIDKSGLSKTSEYNRELNISRQETATESILKSNVMKPERDYEQDCTKEVVSSSARSRFEIPVAVAVMDSERERIGSSAFTPSLFSPSSSIKDKTFFQHPIKLEKETAPLSPPVPLSPSVKDCRPTSYFFSLSFTDLALKPEKDTALDQNRKDDAEHHPRATPYQVSPDGAGIEHHDRQTKPDMIELIEKNSSIEKLSLSKNSSHRKDLEKSGSSRNSSLNANDYLERSQKRLTKTNSLENIKQDMEGPISSSSYNDSKSENFEKNAPFTKPHLTIKESLGKLSADSFGHVEANCQEKRILSSLESQSIPVCRNSPAETEGKRISNKRSPRDTGAQGKTISNNVQQRSRPSRIDESSASPPQQQSSQADSSASAKLSGVNNTQGNDPPKPTAANKPSSVPNTPTSGNPKYSTFFSYTRRQSLPQSHRSDDIRNENSAKQDTSSSSKFKDKSKQCSKQNSPAPSTNPLAPSRSQPSAAAEQNIFAISEKALIEKGASNGPINKQLSRNMRHERLAITKSVSLSVEHMLSNKTQDNTDMRNDSSDLASSKSGNVRQLVLRSPTSPTSSSNSSSSSPSPRLPLNKSMFYFPQSGRAEKQLSPTEHLNSSGQKGFVITDTSRQSRMRSKNVESNDHVVSQRASSPVTEIEKKESRPTNKMAEKSNFENPSAGAGLATELDVEEIKSIKSGEKSSVLSKVAKPATKADGVNVILDRKEITGRGSHPSTATKPSKYDHNKINLKLEDVKKQEHGMEKRLEKSGQRNRHYSESSEEVKQSPSSKERNVTGIGEEVVSRERGRSIDLRQIYNSARRASLTPRPETTSSRSPSPSTTSRPNSALDKRPPSPGRLDSKELLGHFVKKVLNSANTAKPNGGSPSSSFAVGPSQQSRESKPDILGNYASSPRRERKTSSENKHQERKGSLGRKQEEERKERIMSHERKQQHVDQDKYSNTRVRKSSSGMESRHDDQGRIDATRDRKQRKVSQEMQQQYGNQGKIDAARERKVSLERAEQHGDQRRIDAARERKVSHDRERQHDNQQRTGDAARERKTSHERHNDDQHRTDATRDRKTPYERKQKHEERERIDPKKDRRISNDNEPHNERVEAAELERRLSDENDKQPSRHKVGENPMLTLNKEVLETQQEFLDTSGENNVLNKLVDMIHDEFAFDGYLDDGIEDVNMGEYVMSLSGMSEDMFKESVRDQYSDLYWDDDLLQDMYILVNRKLTSRRPTLRFSESIASDVSRPGSSQSMESNADSSHLTTRSVSRTSSERSFLETRDYVMSSLGEPTQFLPFKMICPEITRDIIEELGPVFEDYQKEMKIKLAPSISELMEKLGAKILEIGQQLTLERRAKKKNIASFKKVADIDHKKDVKDLASKLLQEIEESDKKIIYLKYIQRRLRNIYAERFGLDHSLLFSFVSSYNIKNVSLEPKRQNNLLSFSPLWDQRSNQSSEAHGESTRGPVLQYGTNQGLFSYLFARHSMSQAFVRFFLYTFRYCATPDELFYFILDKCRASLRAETGSDKTYNHQLQIRYRALDLLAEWIDCSFQFDFKTNPGLLQSLFTFLDQELIPVDKTDRGKMLVELITEKQRKDEEEHIEETSDTLAVLQNEDNQGSILEKDSSKKFPIKRKKSPAQCFKRGSPQASSMYKPTVYLKAMSVIDHSSRTIAEQLTLIQQDVFARVHSIHFLNSRTLGIGVGRLSPNKETTQLDSMLGFSAGRRRSITSETLNQSDSSSLSPRTSGESNLFVCQPVTDGCLEDLLMHAQDVSMWVAVEICSAPSIKNQLVLIQKYISVAKYCAEMRNFATSVQVVDALEMFVIRQLPVWKQVPNKVIQTLEELKAIKVLLKTDSSWLLKDNAYREKPTMPCALLFLMHIQQLELGGFTLANGMYKWTKMRSIARLVDQIRLFKQMRYAFDSSEVLKDRLRMRIRECREENLHALAAENAANFHLSSSQSSRKFQEAFKKMKATFGNG